MLCTANNLLTTPNKQLFFYFCSGRPGGGTGRHAGLKILWPLRLYGFDSRPGYKKGFSIQENPFLFLTKILSIKKAPLGAFWSERRGSNSRPRPWQGRALPTELLSHWVGKIKRISFCANIKCKF
jgi:hypothetical protein